MILVFLFLQNLRRIIGTVSEGDPFMPVDFMPVKARRLTAMAGLMPAVELPAMPIAAIGFRLVGIFEQAREAWARGVRNSAWISAARSW